MIYKPCKHWDLHMEEKLPSKTSSEGHLMIDFKAKGNLLDLLIFNLNPLVKWIECI